MPTPDVVINVSGARPSTPNPSDIGQAFAALVTQRGSIANPRMLQSPADYLLYCGARQPSSVASDWVETYFAEGGSVLYASRVASATAAQATLNLVDGTAGVSLVYKAGQLGDPDPGTWANGATGGLSVAVLSPGAGQFQIQTLLNSIVVETSPVFTTQADAIAWFAANSLYGTLTLGASALIPVAAGAANLAGGTDGAAIADADYQAALDRIPAYLGPGQVCAPGRTTLLGGQQLLLHAQARNRFAVLDGTDTSSDATLEAQAQALYATANNGRRYGQLFAPWDVIPGLTQYTTRVVPPSARAAAAYAKVSALGNPNQAAAGRNGEAQFVQDLSQPNWTDTQRGALNAAGVTISRRRFAGAIRIYGMRTLADQATDPNWSMAPNVRAIMWYSQQAHLIGEAHNFDNVDPFGHELAAYKGDLMGAAKVLYDAGALWGTTPSSCLSVDTGPAANPPAQLAQGIVGANVELRLSPTPERVVINITKTPMTQAL